MKSILIFQCVCVIVAFAAASPPLPQPGDSQDHLAENCRIPKCPEIKSSADKDRVVNLPYPMDCLQYVVCKGTEATVVPCPPDLVFDKNTGVCDTPQRARCVPCYQQG